MSQAASQDALPPFPRLRGVGRVFPPCTTHVRGFAETLMMRFTLEFYLLVPRRSNASDIYKKLEFPASSVVQFQMLFGFQLCSLISSQLGPCVSVKAESFRALSSQFSKDLTCGWNGLLQLCVKLKRGTHARTMCLNCCVPTAVQGCGPAPGFPFREGELQVWLLVPRRARSNLEQRAAGAGRCGTARCHEGLPSPSIGQGWKSNQAFSLGGYFKREYMLSHELSH